MQELLSVVRQLVYNTISFFCSTSICLQYKIFFLYYKTVSTARYLLSIVQEFVSSTGSSVVHEFVYGTRSYLCSTRIHPQYMIFFLLCKNLPTATFFSAGQEFAYDRRSSFCNLRTFYITNSFLIIEHFVYCQNPPPAAFAFP